MVSDEKNTREQRDVEVSTVLVAAYDPQLCRMLWRILSRRFSMVLTATDIEKAESILERHEVTHLVADHSFGSEEMSSFELVSRLRREHLSIQRVAILTGTDYSNIEIPKEIDSVVLKTDPTDKLVRVLVC